ncbi:facilitated trehalose transporter Tret1 isoform X2 [Bicyclus anynana]|uniref:Facilitated trehalose transporter Tret1 isoform X2 n=1 Tax=Bicyclus anynana TaxID=110368 RepID=A0ABM3LLA8_BICAN|nr:facilitated trehalose transporter Tret1 isoform X2 [Bicyclus anynana]
MGMMTGFQNIDFFRYIRVNKMFICSGVTSYFFIYGLFFGAPTVYVPQIRKEANSTDAINMETMSWLFSISSYGSLPWAIICPIIAERYGRKVPYMILWVNTMVSVSLFYFSKSVTELFISGFLQGMLQTIQIGVSIMVLTEYVSPKYRGIFITFKSATFYWGIWISNAIGTFFHWKNIGILVFSCCVYNFSILFWPESPYWLASKGRFEECAKCHRWLKGEDKDAEEELKMLILSSKENLKRKQERREGNQPNSIVRVYNTVKARRFYKPLIPSVLTICLYHFSGKLACTGYVIEIIKSITVSESTAYEGMLVLDGITVLGMYVGVSFTKFFKRRPLLFISAIIGVIFLFALSLYLYLISLKVISENKYLTLFLLMGFSVTISCGPMILSMCFSTELTPLKGRSIFISIFTLSTCTIMGSILKISPYIFKYFASHGAFLFYAIMSSIFIAILYKILPETKDKTIQEIEKYFCDNDNVVEEQELMNPTDARIK